MWVSYQGHDITTKDMGLFLNMAGNAFPCFHYLPWMASMLSTWGLYLSVPPPSPHASAVVQPPAIDQDRRLSTVALHDSFFEPDSD